MSKTINKDSTVAHETIIQGNYFNSKPSNEMSLKFQWVGFDSRGIELQSQFFGLSVNGGDFIDVEDVVNMWRKRDSLCKSNDNN